MAAKVAVHLAAQTGGARIGAIPALRVPRESDRTTAVTVLGREESLRGLGVATVARAPSVAPAPGAIGTGIGGTARAATGTVASVPGRDVTTVVSALVVNETVEVDLTGGRERHGVVRLGARVVDVRGHGADEMAGVGKTARVVTRTASSGRLIRRSMTRLPVTSLRRASVVS